MLKETPIELHKNISILILSIVTWHKEKLKPLKSIMNSSKSEVIEKRP